MKRVKCKSGANGCQEKLQQRYRDFNDFKNWCRTYNIHGRLGYVSMKSAWTSNPTIQSSTEPSDLSRVFFHAVKRKDGSFRVKESTSKYCSEVKNSHASFGNKEAVLSWIGTK